MTRTRWPTARHGSAMEYVDGLRITDYCREHDSSIAERMRLFRSVCEAVQHAHSRAIIHCDLKPSNILVTADGTVKLLDFGIARQLETEGEPVDLTRTGMRPMTLAYAAPEQIRGERLGTQADVYSLGVVLYELLSGRLPFDLSNRKPSGSGAHSSGEGSGTAFGGSGAAIQGTGREQARANGEENSMGRFGRPHTDRHAQGCEQALPVSGGLDPGR